MPSGKYCVPSCDQNGKACFAEALFKRAQLTWAALRQAGGEGLGYEWMPRYRIRASIPPGITEDVDKFMVFRCIGKAPMVGYREGVTFHVLWIDHDFSLYDHGS